MAGYLRKKLISFYCGQERKWGCSITYHHYSGLTAASCGTLFWRQRACEGRHNIAHQHHSIFEEKTSPILLLDKLDHRGAAICLAEMRVVTYSEGIAPSAAPPCMQLLETFEYSKLKCWRLLAAKLLKILKAEQIFIFPSCIAISWLWPPLLCHYSCRWCVTIPRRGSWYYYI